MNERKVTIPPEGFQDYEWDEDFKLVMFALEIAREMASGENGYIDHEAKLWGFKDRNEIYDLLWNRFKYFKGKAFDDKFKIVQSEIHCSHCGNKITFAEIKPMSISAKYKQPDFPV